MDSKSMIEENIRAHDAIAEPYDAYHKEIFNSVEQSRLKTSIEEALKHVKSASGRAVALDVGCGTGNLVRHLLDLDADVTATDVSGKMLELVAKRYADTGRCKTALLNGEDLSQFADESFDFVGTYSVLHHIPDYLAAVREMTRVLKPGGVLYLDHEKSPAFWHSSPAYTKWRMIRNGVRIPRSLRIGRYFSVAYWKKRGEKMRNKRYQGQGDIHVWPDDHIEWDKIEEVLKVTNCEVVSVADYLVFVEGYSLKHYEEMKNQCDDTRAVVAVKRALDTSI